MESGILFYAVIATAFTLVLLFVYLSQKKELDMYIRHNRVLKTRVDFLDECARNAFKNADPGLLYVVPERNDLEKQVAEGCTIINQQRETITKLQKLLHQSQQLNKRLK
jgi:hypothetical protein